MQELFEQARFQIAQGSFGLEELETLRTELTRTPRQRLLYLYAMQPTVRAVIVASTVQDPEDSSLCQIDPEAEDLPYKSVMDAIADGWRVIHFPDHRASYQEGRLDMLGYEFVLEKWGMYGG